ncbi:calcium-binding protein [Allosphingosinicella sp.]|uniref:calcium-binding protein n=1 Tax=Allosphingosinicella sp. TaxID=2823234 RepID=UPI0037837E66
MPQTAVTDYTKVSTTVLGSQFAPAVTALSGGGYVIVWQDFNAGAIYAQRYNASGQAVGTELHVDSTQGGSPLWVSVAATANDGFVIAFQAGGFSQAEIYARRYDSVNNPVGGLFQVNTTSPNEQFNPHVTALDNGGLLFTWDTQALDVFQEVRGRIYGADGLPVGNDFAIAPMSASVKNGLSAIAPLSGGGFVVTWQQAAGGGDNYEIVGQRYSAGGATVGAQFQVNTQTTNNQYGNDVARLSDGGFVVSWIDPGTNNVGGRVVARRYDASGIAIGGEIVIDTKASGAYGRTVVTALANGGYVVAWPDGENDTNVAHNVSARAFSSNDQPLDVAFDISFDSPFGANFFSDGAVTLANGNVVFTWDGPSVTPPGGQGTGEDVYMRVYSFSGSGSNQPTEGPDTLTGTSGDDTMNGLGGEDILRGLGGDDGLLGGPGDDLLDGGDGNDSLHGQEGDDGLLGGDGNDFLDGGDGDDSLHGQDGSDTLVGGAGSDFLDGGAGADVMYGGAGNDIYIANAGDYIVEHSGEGSDLVYTTTSFTLGAGQEIEILSAGDATGTAAIDLTGNELNNTLWGNAAANLLTGGDGADDLHGFGGIDGLLGGDGNDFLDGGDGDDSLHGQDGSDTLVGGAGNDFLDGGAGADVMYGGAGNDTYIAGAGDYIVEAVGGGTDLVYATTSFALSAGQEIETLAAASGTAAIDLTGNEFANTLIGNDGNNILDGGLGNDLLVGQGGADTFAFTTALGANNVDAVSGFTHGEDMIALDHGIFAGIGSNSFNASAFVTGTQAGDADDRIIYNSATGQLFYDADGNGAGAAVLFATLQGAPTLTASDFQVI